MDNMNNQNNKAILFSGIKPTGIPHIGNFLGALKNWVDLQNSNQYQPIYSVVDYHALTIDIDPETLMKNSLNTAKILLGIGIDPKKSILFIQSHVPAHTELAWIFNCLTPLAELERMTQYKDKAKQHYKNINMGLLDYPALMAADILLYHGEIVPVGGDQLQHLELTRLIVKKFNNRYGQYFKEPQAITVSAKKIMSLNNPQKKMSKDLGEASYISLLDTEDIIIKKIKKAITDTGPKQDGMSAGVANLINLLIYFDNQSAAINFTEQYKQKTIQYTKLKQTVGETIINTLKPIQKNINSLSDDNVLQILKDGATKANQFAEKNIKEIKKIIGLIN